MPQCEELLQQFFDGAEHTTADVIKYLYSAISNAKQKNLQQKLSIPKGHYVLVYLP